VARTKTQNPSLGELEAKRASLRTVRALLARAVQSPTVPWTAVSKFVGQESDLAAEVASLEAALGDRGAKGVSAERLRQAILALPDDLLPTVEDALVERKALG